MKITKKYLMKIINEETSRLLREVDSQELKKTRAAYIKAGIMNPDGTAVDRRKKRFKGKFTRAAARKGKRQLELYKTLGSDFPPNDREAIKTHQVRLAMLGWGFMMPKTIAGRGGEPDGIYGPETIKATAAFQKSVGLTPDGLWGGDSEGRMGQVLGGELKPKAPERVIQHLTKSKAHGGMGVTFAGEGGGARATDVGRQGDEVEASEETPTGQQGFGGATKALKSVPAAPKKEPGVLDRLGAFLGQGVEPAEEEDDEDALSGNLF